MKLKKSNKKMPAIIKRIIAVAIFIGIWQLVCTIIDINKFLPAPSTIVSELFKILVEGFGKHKLFGHVYFSLKRVVIAFLIGGCIGVPLGLLIGWNRTVRAIVKPIFELLRCIPPIAWIPLMILWFGIGEVSKVSICFLGTFIPSMINSQRGILSVEKDYLDVAQMLGASRRQLLFEVAVPSALPAVFAGLQSGLSFSWVAVLAAEMVSSSEGLGFMILKGMEQGSPAIIFAGMITIGIVGMIMAALFRLVERMICPWKQEI